MRNWEGKPTSQLMKKPLKQIIITKRKTDRLINKKPPNPMKTKVENRS